MFPFIGIQADEEPKTSISPSGLYNTAQPSVFEYDLSSPIISGRSEFTFMCWVYKKDAQEIVIYSEDGSQARIRVNSTGELKAILETSAGTSSFVESTSQVPLNTWTHLAITYSLSNNRIRAYLNGVLDSSSIVSYSLDTFTTASFVNFYNNYDLAQPNFYDRELSESEVAEHYVDIDGQVGVLGWDAMTPAQRSGLIYSSSFTKDMSISGNEFTDKSGNNITLSSVPSLTGQQIYFYTDASTTQIYPVNSATFTGSESYTYPNTQAVQGVDATFCYMVRPTDISAARNIFHGMRVDGDNYFILEITPTGLHIENWYSSTLNLDETLSYSFSENSWYGITLSQIAGTLRAYVNGILLGVFTSPLKTNFTSPTITYGAYPTGLNFNGGMSFISYNRTYGYTQSDVTEWYNGGRIKCYSDWGSSLKSGIQAMANLATWTDSNEPILDQTGNGNDLVAVGSPTYTDQGLDVECST